MPSIHLIVSETKQHLFGILITLLSFLIMVFSSSVQEIFRYESYTVSQGEIWRILTANLCHSNWSHWALNLAGFWLMDFFYRPVLSIKHRVSLLLFCMLGSVTLLHLFMQLTWYVGLSGALHGYLIGGALLSWKQAKKLNALIIGVVVVKLFIESTWHINESTEKMIGANVVEESHLFGAIAALVFVICLLLIKKLQPNKQVE